MVRRGAGAGHGLLVVGALTGLGLGVPGVSAQTAAPWPTENWARSAPSEQGLRAEPLEALVEQIEAGQFGNIDRLVVVRHRSLVMDERWTLDYDSISRGRRSPIGCGVDACADPSDIHQFNYLHPRWHPRVDGRDLHTLQSVTKSVTATVVGAAIYHGAIGGVDVPFLSFLGEYDLSGVDPRLRSATLEDLLTMRSGIEWHETDRPLDTTNTTFRMEVAEEDWAQFTLDQPMDAAPGDKWAYNSGGSHLLSAIVRQATGMTLDRYAERHLFGPLGIRDYHWKKTRKGLPDGLGGLYLEALDLARIGVLYLEDGVWNGQRLLPEGWVEAATSIHMERVNGAGFGYGYQWWRIDRGDTPVWAGLGFGGQYLLVVPDLDLVGVVNSWNVFGERVDGVLIPFRDALLGAEGG